LMQHPRGGDAAFGGIEHEHAADIALAGELVIGARKYAAHAIEIVARGETVFRDQRLPAHLSSHAGRREEYLAAHIIDPSTPSFRALTGKPIALSQVLSPYGCAGQARA